jgi:Flp pilus assembly protein TadG
MRRPSARSTHAGDHGRRHGATTVELALVLPVLFLFVFGAFEFSRLNMLKHLAGVAAYEGAREGIVIGATASDVQTQVNAILAAGGVIDATITTTPATISETTTEVQVHVSIPVDGNFWVLPAYASGAVTATSRLSTERQGG